jgi:membrane protease subunit (stomatin/prohibitin family)
MPKLMEVIEFFDDKGDTMVVRIPADGQAEIKWGAQLTVRESQSVVFFRDGKAQMVFGPGRHVLKTQNIPIADINTMIKTKLGIRPKDKEDIAFLKSILENEGK